MAIAAAAARAQEDPKRIYIAPDDHTDYFWTADDAQYQQAFVEMIDYYLDLADATAGNAPEHQSRWNCDGSFWVWAYEKTKTPAEFSRLVARIRDGHISFPLNALVVCLGGAPLEAVLRGMYYAGTLERRFDLQVPIAIAMENQTLPLGLASLWAGAGAKYSWKGICGCDTQVPTAWDREHDIYWMVGPDGNRVLMKWNSMLNGNQGMGGYAEARDPAAVVDYVDGDAAFAARYPYRVIGAFGKGWDDFKTLTNQFVTVAQTKTNPTRKVIVSNERDFFEDFEATYGASIPSKSCSFGNEWDLYCASLAEVSARVKRAVEKLRGAEALAAIVSQHDPGFMDGRVTARETAWMDLGLFWEHNFGMVGPPTGAAGVQKRVAWQRRLADEIEAYTDALQTDAVAALGARVVKTGAAARFFAFNPLGWTRSDAADLAYEGTEPVHVIDLATGQETPSQFVDVEGRRYLRILAKDVPPAGYKVFEVRPGAGQSFVPAAAINGGVVDSAFHRLTAAPRGAILSWLDRQNGDRELVRETGGFAMNDLGPGTGTFQPENVGAVSATLLATATGPLAHTTRITVFRDIARIEIRNEITQNFDGTYTWAFGFNVNSPDVWHEEVGAILRAKVLSAGGHYAERNARYDWLTLNHFADISDGSQGFGVTLSNADCYFMKLGSSSTSGLDADIPRISALAGGKVANGGNGLPSQGGDTRFLQRFGLVAHQGYSPAGAMRFAMEHQNPLVTGVVGGGSVFPEKSFSLLRVTNPHVLLWALKPAEDNPADTVVRLWNVSPEPSSFAVTLPGRAIRNATRLSHIETPQQEAPIIDGALMDVAAPQQVKTYLLASAAGPPILNVRANGNSGLLAVTPADPVRVSISLGPGGLAGIEHDWWLFSLSSYGASALWSTTGKLIPLPDSEVFTAELPQGWYIFVFVLDDSPNGVYDRFTWIDSVVVLSAAPGSRVEAPADAEGLIRRELGSLIGRRISSKSIGRGQVPGRRQAR